MKGLIAISIFFSFAASAQYSTLQSQYMFNAIALNPAAAGTENAMSVVGTFRAQWIGFPGAPTTEALAIHAPLKTMNSSVGVQLFADQIGVDKTTNLTGLYSYRFKFAQANLRVGISGGVSFIQSNYADLQVVSPDDDQISTNTQLGMRPDFGLGLYYTAKKYFVSLSLPALLGQRYEMSQFRVYSNVNNYNLLVGGGYEFELPNEMALKPSILMKFRRNNRPQVDFNAKLKLNPVFQVGLSYRTEEAIIGMFEARATNQLSVMYSFGMPISSIAKSTYGSHELSIKYNFLYKSTTQSPRFLGW